MKSTLIFSFVLMAFGCTEETYIEGLTPVVKSFNINKSMPIVHGQTAACTLKIEGTTFLIQFLMTRYRAMTTDTYYGITVQDSVIFVNVMTDLSLEMKAGSINRYSKDQLMNNTSSYGSANVPLFAAIKKRPYITSYYNPLGIAGKNPLNFGVNQDGYIAFKAIAKTGSPVYGWIHITTSDKKIIVDKYAYQTFDYIKAGQE